MFGKSMTRAGALPAEPTPALPGSEEKIRVMMERASRREQLFHPLDGLVQSAPAPEPLALQPALIASLAVYPADDLEPVLLEDLRDIDDPELVPALNGPCPTAELAS